MAQFQKKNRQSASLSQKLSKQKYNISIVPTINHVTLIYLGMPKVIFFSSLYYI
jgi:hypothetical protein